MTDHAIANWFSRPGDTIRTMMERRGISAQHLADHVEGGLARVRGLLDGSQRVDARTALRLSEVVGATEKFWLKRQENFDAAVERAVSQVSATEPEDLLLSIPAPGDKPRGKLSAERRTEEIRRRLVFFNVPNMECYASRYGKLISNTDFRKSNTFATKDDATLLWLRRGELESDLVATKAWNPAVLREKLPSICKLSRLGRPAVFIPRLREQLAEAGVALVIVKAPKGCTASGASRMVDADKAMLLVSFRYRSDEQFWFTIFHEIGHLLLHKAHTFVDAPSTPLDDKEREANEFAARCIVPENRMSEFERIGHDKDSIVRFSVSVGVAAGLIVGQMQHRKMLPQEKMNGVKRTWTWEQIDPALI
ncbi:ImmA/IrrE family metallo-endopeptidase [Rhizobium leguminosarum]|uniref:ImmA/IrrE family metallo-endopeptidase n=1 Tax=Rhizobium leguminosarum TaxID=384 RepID=A0A6P0B2I9_RHILE|nr:ImmA/IrrE family metallo-endopeptidase [Rhizobium leguminosarum]MBY5846394.1 ImmA/IrrE family metallo-endopeptidase [Rhizobium leguminosarum]NEI33618.1 ImmA/IrrE family metallo-endopeptidase [Rhizobium leguminosarum]NEI42929.1 ImmA/IrrE family metallo-endopeptidase [Rhizobium leguminosarum]